MNRGGENDCGLTIARAKECVGGVRGGYANWHKSEARDRHRLDQTKEALPFCCCCCCGCWPNWLVLNDGALFEVVMPNWGPPTPVVEEPRKEGIGGALLPLPNALDNPVVMGNIDARKGFAPAAPPVICGRSPTPGDLPSALNAPVS